MAANIDCVTGTGIVVVVETGTSEEDGLLGPRVELNSSKVVDSVG